MTETEWLTSEDPERMLANMNGPPGPTCPSDRKLRLFACAVSRAIPPNLSERDSPEVVDWAEQVADGKLKLSNVPHTGRDELVESAADAARYACDPAWGGGDRKGVTQVMKANLFRENVGNPFRPVTLPRPPGPVPFRTQFGGGLKWPGDCPWLTPTVRSLAHVAYDERLPDGTLDPVRLAILSDALEEAGCDNEDLLRHLRGEEICPACMGALTSRTGTAQHGYTVEPCKTCNRTGWVPLRSPHVRGCWAVDLTLGRD